MIPTGNWRVWRDDVLINDREKVNIYTYILALYLAVLPVNTGVAVFGDISISNLIAAVFVALGLYCFIRNPSKSFTRALIPVVLYYCFFLVSLLWSNRSSGLWYVATFFMNACIVMVGATMVFSRRDVTVLETAILIGLLPALISTLVCFGSIAEEGRLFVVLSRSIDPNQFAFDCFPIIALVLWKAGKDEGNKYVLYAVIAVTLAIIVLTGSRGAALGVFSMLFFHLLISFGEMKKSIRTVIRFVAPLVLFIVLFFMIPKLIESDRFTAETVVADSGSGRFDIWKSALSVFRSSDFVHCLFGYGFGSFPDVVKVPTVIGTYYYAHNMVIQALIEGGIIGVLLLAGMFLGIFIVSLKLRNAFLSVLIVGVAVAGMSIDIEAARLFGVSLLLPFIYLNSSEKGTVSEAVT